MRLSKQAFAGTGKVYAFTLQQYAKSRSNWITLLVLLLCVLAAGPVLSLTAGNLSFGKPDASLLRVVRYQNDTAFAPDFSQPDERWANLSFESAQMDESSCADSLQLWEVYAHFFFDEESGSYLCRVIPGKECAADAAELNALGDWLTTRFSEARYLALGTNAQQQTQLNADVQFGVSSVEEFLSPESGPGLEARMVIQYLYAIVVLMLCSFSTAYIIRAVIEEKVSKLVELLMVSVRPLALIAGKILAVMTYLFASLALLLGAGAVSVLLSGGALLGSLESMGISLSQLRLSPLTIVVALISLLLAYLLFSVLGGLSGVCCSSMEDMESANMSVLLTILGGYMVSCFTGMLEGAGAVVISLLPIVSVFSAPVQWVCGSIGLGTLVISWLLQAAVIVLISLLCSRVYADLIIYKGSRVRLSRVLAMARKPKKEEKLG